MRIAALLATLALAACAALPASDERAVAAHFESLRDRPPELAMFLRRMPKGGDLHNHLSGAIYAESLIRWAAEDGLCLIVASTAFTAPPCEDTGKPAVADHIRSSAAYNGLIDALSTRNYQQGQRSGHDQFFVTFARFGAATEKRAGDMLAEVTTRAAAQNVAYLELMFSPRMAEARSLGSRVGWDGDASATLARLRAAGLADSVPRASQDIDDAERRQRTLLGCGEAKPPACAVTIRYVAQVTRTLTPAEVFAQTALAFELVRREPRIVGLNFVAPEDDRTALADYRLHMRMIRDLAALMPDVPVTLHAGELWLGLVPPEALRFHIREAIEVAGARRIGHGVAIAFEDHAEQLLAEMARRRVMVEINLTSNDVILDVRGAQHPLPLYLRHGVPVALSTDDEGVSRTDLSNEYRRAVETHGLSYAQIKTMVRNSLSYSFLKGDSLWRGATAARPVPACAADRPAAAPPSPPCAAFLAGSEKATLQWRLEAELAAFERGVLAAPRR